jgi:hypothetical protein
MALIWTRVELNERSGGPRSHEDAGGCLPDHPCLAGARSADAPRSQVGPDRARLASDLDRPQVLPAGHVDHDECVLVSWPVEATVIGQRLRDRLSEGR